MTTGLLAPAYWGSAAAHVVGRITGAERVGTVAKTAMMPLLGLWVRGRGGPPGLVAALFLSAAGDLLMERRRLVPAMVAYAGAHLCYFTLFIRHGGRWSVRAATAYAALGVAVVTALWPELGPLRGPVSGYALFLSAMAAAAARHDRRTASGGALFVVSDILIALRLTGHDFPGRSQLVGLTYTAGQYRLATGLVRAGGDGRRPGA